ncbi:hypothetical protein [Micromonospora sp. NPDC005305]|uniref:hypothetical protein n=1 Tax=Micromonospora sp. NPDC005305 TaxID=3156875 RepID=UPI0033AAE797
MVLSTGPRRSAAPVVVDRIGEIGHFQTSVRPVVGVSPQNPGFPNACSDKWYVDLERMFYPGVP